MSRSEWRNVLLLALVVVGLTTAPYVLAWSKQDDAWRFTGFLFGVEDGNSYLGKMRLGARGEWNFSLFYTPEAHDGAPLVFLPYILPGQIVGRFISDTDPALTPTLILTFHLMRIAFDALLIVVIYRFCSAFLSEPRDRLIATILATAWRLGLVAIAGGAERAARRFHPRRLRLPDRVPACRIWRWHGRRCWAACWR
ncbi:MAG: hypothetical protein U0703_17790 [Anaerolineae bacterium]